MRSASRIRVGAALVVMAGCAQAVAAEVSRAAQPGFVATAAVRPASDETVNAMVHLYAEKPKARRARVRAVVTGAEAGSSLRLLVSRSSCRRLRSRDLSSAQRVLSLEADDAGRAVAGISRPARAVKTTRDLIQYSALAVATSGDGGDALLGCAALEQVRPPRPGERPSVIVGTLSQSTGGGTMVADMMKMNMQLKAGAVTITHLMSASGMDPWRVSVGGCPGGGDPQLVLGDVQGGPSIVRTRLTLDRRKARALIRGDAHLGLYQPESEESQLCSAAVQIGKLLGVNY